MDLRAEGFSPIALSYETTFGTFVAKENATSQSQFREASQVAPLSRAANKQYSYVLYLEPRLLAADALRERERVAQVARGEDGDRGARGPGSEHERAVDFDERFGS